MKADQSVLFLGKKDDPHTLRAVHFCEKNFSKVQVHLSGWGERLPEEARDWEGDYIISYLSRWVVPDSLLSRARLAAINFHPASPEYPGIGCNNFALYENASSYGVTCHHMAPRVDTGDLIAVKRFPVFASDDVASLLHRTYDHQLVLFYEIVGKILLGEKLPVLSETWTRRPFTRKEFNDLNVIAPEMPHDEIARRIRATSFGKFQPQLEIGPYVFKFEGPKGV